jgi:hypothetical protein
VWLLLVGASLVAATARAQSASDAPAADDRRVIAALAWDAADPACPTREALERAIEERLGRTVFPLADRADVTVRGAASRGEQGHWRASLELRRADGTIAGTRALETTSDDCAVLIESLPLVVALMIDLPREHVSLRIPTPSPPAPPAARAPEPQSEAWGGSLAAGAALALGILPGVHGGVRVAAELRPPGPLSLRVAGSLWAPSESRSELGASRSFAVLAGAAACLGGSGDLLSIDGCLGADGGYFEAEGRGFDENSSDSGGLAILHGSAIGALRLGGPWWVALELRLLVPLIRRVFAVSSGSGDVPFFESAPVAGEAALALSVRFGR